MAEIDRAKLVAYLKAKADIRDPHKTSGLVAAAVLDGVRAQIEAGEFDKEDEDG